MKVNVDENRFEQELIYYLEKLDITEEKYVWQITWLFPGNHQRNGS
jgi:hypothetical protein